MKIKKNFFIKSVLKTSNSIREAILNLNNTGLQICFVCDERKLLGTVTDGDIRRAIIKNKNLNNSVKEIMNKNYLSIRESSTAQRAQTLMSYYKINQIPVVGKNNELINVFFAETIENLVEYKNPVIIMAGGYGKRLMPLTKYCPKPLLPLLGKPIIEHIIIKLKNEGFKNIFISTHYLANMIKDYFGSGNKLGVSINYIDENIPLGTAGCLSKFDPNNNMDFIVCNGDVLTGISFSKLLNYHLKNKSSATMAVKEYFFQNPFGVVKTNGLKIKSITEKPLKKSYINAGIYVFKNRIKKILKKNKKIDMPDFFRLLTRKKHKTIVFPIFENWIDIGDAKEYESVQKKF